MVHTALASIFVLQFLISQSRLFSLFLAACRGLGSQQNRAILKGDVIIIVRTVFVAQLHRQGDFHHVASSPGAVYLHIASRARSHLHIHSLAVYLHLVAFASPLRTAHCQAEGTALVDGYLAALGVRERCFLGQGEMLILQLGSGEEIDIQRLIVF